MERGARPRDMGLMLPPALVTWMFRLSLLGLLTVIGIYVALFLMIARPGAFFTHADGNGAITFHSERAIPPESRLLAQEVTTLLANGPLGAPGQPIDIWLVDGGWPLRIFFAGSPRASGLTYPVASLNNVFLRHADLSMNRLVRDGRPVAPPRTLSYFLVHEITHLQVAEYVGRWRVVRMPRWVNEGYADYVALGPASPEMIAATLSGVRLPRAAFGTYPRERACVTLALAHLSDPAALFDIDADLPAEGGCPRLPEFGIALMRAPQ